MLNASEKLTLKFLIKEEIESTKDLIEKSPEDAEELNDHIKELESIYSKLGL